MLTLFKDFSKYTALSVFGMMAISVYILADTFFVAQGLGTNGLAALNLGIPVYNFIHGVGLLLGMGGATKFSIYMSKQEEHKGRQMFTLTIYLGIMFSLLFITTGLGLSETLARLSGADASVFDMTNTYMKVLLLFSPAFIFNDILLCFVRNEGNPRLAMIATVSGSMANIILDYVFIFPCNMGIFGAVFATGISPVIGILMMVPYCLKPQRRFKWIKTKLDGSMIKDNILIGFPSFLAQISSGIVMIVFNSIILGLSGNVGVAAYGVVANISLVVVSIYTGIAQGVQPLISSAHGKEDKHQIHRLLHYANITMLVISCIIYGLIVMFDQSIVHVFNSENSLELQRIASMGLKIYFTANIFLGYNTILSTYFTSVERVKPAHVLSLLRGIVLIVPMAYLLSSLFNMTGVWLALPVTELIVAVLGFYLYKRGQ